MFGITLLIGITNMQFITTVTQKGQVTIPKSIRNQIGINLNGRVLVKSNNNVVEISPTFDILDLAGTIVPKKMKTIDMARKAMEKHYVRI
ncbi:hypothetical protein COW98_03075 [Candidatus Roizmanbacteria bacterium CG22_combo_CG10-13_8_21_14_all_35_9]|uniref:SpoVT-AbrB domain-containing protein n=1 Tax=Candidatus Roizmanbacteria bacterium CG22_combo_CG10-13_8_21_14_all_35_9 TaxID=1974861 RepID=A0A2H0BY31_9BACT|nr:MAG: hypothetical protein COW98_03075 [Candidatus Roizmanbacteria bacterium CG22_combo_CG10-13_8_21_14_all_35_9]